MAGLGRSASKGGADDTGPAESCDAAIDQLLGSATPVAVLPGTLRLLAGAFDCEAAVALRLAADHDGAVLASYPEGFATEGLISELAKVTESCPEPPGEAEESGTVTSRVRPADAGAQAPLNALIAYPKTAACRPTTILALIRPRGRWSDQARAACRTVVKLLDLRLAHIVDQTELTRTVLTIRELISAVPVALIAVDQTGKATEFNPAADRLFGLGREQVLGRDLIGLIAPPVHQAGVRDWALRRAGSGPIASWSEPRNATMTRADGTEFAARLTPLRLRLPAGPSLGLYATADTEIERALESVRDSEARFRALADLAPIGIIQLDKQRRFVFVNDRWTEWTGISREHMLGRLLTDAIDMIDVPRIEAEAARAIVDGTDLGTDCRVRTASGTPLWAHLAMVTLRDPRGGHVGYLAALTNVTARKKYADERERLLAAEQKARHRAELATEELSGHNERLREANQFKSDLLTSVSHDLRNPLTSVISFTELIKSKDPSLSDQTSEFLSIISRNADQLLRLVGDLLLLSKLEAGVIPIEPGSVDVRALISQIVAANSAPAAARGVRLRGSAEDGPTVRRDEFRLRQVLDNLVSNAIKFSADDGEVTITATQRAGTWRIDVTDHGIGIPEDELGALFGRFFRASNAQTERTPGTGVGLSIVKNITEMHGGTVTAESKLGTGSTFTVTLPVASQ